MDPPDFNGYTMKTGLFRKGYLYRNIEAGTYWRKEKKQHRLHTCISSERLSASSKHRLAKARQEMSKCSLIIWIFKNFRVKEGWSPKQQVIWLAIYLNSLEMQRFAIWCGWNDWTQKYNVSQEFCFEIFTAEEENTSTVGMFRNLKNTPKLQNARRENSSDM